MESCCPNWRPTSQSQPVERANCAASRHIARKGALVVALVAAGDAAAVRRLRRFSGLAGLEELLDAVDQRCGVSEWRDRLAERDLDTVAPGEQTAAQALRPQRPGRHRRSRAGHADRHDREVVVRGQYGGAAPYAAAAVPVVLAAA